MDVGARDPRADHSDTLADNHRNGHGSVECDIFQLYGNFDKPGREFPAI